jgi:hypothetical protein
MDPPALQCSDLYIASSACLEVVPTKVLSLCGVCLRVLCALAIVGFGSWDLESPFLWQEH